MAEVILLCGRICCGKGTYAEALRKEKKAVILSTDEIMLALFGQDAGEQHDLLVEKAWQYLYRKSAQIAETGIPVILDCGFWTREKRDEARRFYRERGIPYEFRYIDISEEEWHRRLRKRNATASPDAYFVDEGLAAKCEALFEIPDPAETDVRFVNETNQRGEIPE